MHLFNDNFNSFLHHFPILLKCLQVCANKSLLHTIRFNSSFLHRSQCNWMAILSNFPYNNLYVFTFGFVISIHFVHFSILQHQVMCGHSLNVMNLDRPPAWNLSHLRIMKVVELLIFRALQ